MSFEPQWLATGATADIYTWEGGQVLKLLHKGRPPEAIQQEARKTQAAHEAGLPAPRVGERADFGGRYGWLFEHVEGALLSDMLMQSGDVSAAAEIMSTLHSRVHGTPTRALPDLRLRIRRDIKAAPLDEPLRQRALLLLEHLPDGDSFCHGDFHPGNIIISDSGPVLIDWQDATRGHALADVARTLVLIGGYPYQVPTERRDRVQHLTSDLMLAYLKAYCTRTRASREAIIPWIVPVAAARLAEGHEAEHTYLTELAGGKTLL